MATAEEDKKTTSNVKKSAALQAEKPPVVVSPSAATESWVYLGPTIMKGKLKKNATYLKFPEFAREAYNKHYQVQELFVPVLESLEVHIALYDRDSVQSFYYRELEKMVKRGEI